MLDYELCLYDTQGATLIGLEQEFLTSARLDNLLSCYIGLQALLDTPAAGAGAGCWSAMIMKRLAVLVHVVRRGRCWRSGWSALCRMWTTAIAHWPASMLISADNAHGVHPNFADRHDDNHGPLLNRGPVIKINANQRYATNSETSSIFRHLAAQAGGAGAEFCGALRYGLRLVPSGQSRPESWACVRWMSVCLSLLCTRSVNWREVRMHTGYTVCCSVSWQSLGCNQSRVLASLKLFSCSSRSGSCFMTSVMALLAPGLLSLRQAVSICCSCAARRLQPMVPSTTLNSV